MSLTLMSPPAISTPSEASTLVDLANNYFFRISNKTSSLPSFTTYANNFFVNDTKNVMSVYIKGLENITNQKEVTLELEEIKKRRKTQSLVTCTARQVDFTIFYIDSPPVAPTTPLTHGLLRLF